VAGSHFVGRFVEELGVDAVYGGVEQAERFAVEVLGVERGDKVVCVGIVAAEIVQMEIQRARDADREALQTLIRVRRHARSRHLPIAGARGPAPTQGFLPAPSAITGELGERFDLRRSNGAALKNFVSPIALTIDI
jgi:hypothetical protein